MKITKITIPTTNYDTSRTKIDTVFIHWIVGSLSSADAVFKKQSGGTSAHYAVEDDNVHQYVDEKHTAYHSGVYSWNQRSIGIEHSADPNRPASELTYQTSGKLIAEIASRYGIPLDREHIKGHKEVRNTQCPGTMDIDRLISIAKSNQVKMVTIPQAELDQMRTDRDNNWNSFQTCEKSVAGHKSRVTDLENQNEKLTGELGVAKEKKKIAEEALAEKQKECYIEVSAIKTQYEELIKDIPDIETIHKEYERMLGVERESNLQLQKKYDKARLDLARVTSQFKSLSLIEKFKLLFLR